jgi:hypothetical protein
VIANVLTFGDPGGAPVNGGPGTALFQRSTPPQYRVNGTDVLDGSQSGKSRQLNTDITRRFLPANSTSLRIISKSVRATLAWAVTFTFAAFRTEYDYQDAAFISAGPRLAVPTR